MVFDDICIWRFKMFQDVHSMSNLFAELRVHQGASIDPPAGRGTEMNAR